MKSRLNLLSGGAGLLLASLCVSGVAAPIASHWAFTDLGDLPGGTDFSRAYAINNTGQVVGVSSTDSGQRAFLWQQGQGMTDLGDLPGGPANSVGLGISSTGQVVGNSDTAAGQRAFVWQNGAMSEVPFMPGTDVSATAINDSGQILLHRNFDSSASEAFLWDGGATTSLGDLVRSQQYPFCPCFSRAYALNNLGDVVGVSSPPGTLGATNHAFLWHQGTMIDLGASHYSSPNRYESIAFDINDRGQAVGWEQPGDGASEARAVIWTDQGRTATALIGLPGTTASAARAINAHDQVVGSNSVGGNVVPVLWSDGRAYDLNALEGVRDGLFEILAAWDINDAGQIVGLAQLRGTSTTHAFFLSPDETRTVQEAGSMALSATVVGAALLGSVRCKRKRVQVERRCW